MRPSSRLSELEIIEHKPDWESRTMSGGWRELIGHYKCGCGAIYRKTITTTPFETDDADCEVCGNRMDGWYNTTGFRSFELISSQPKRSGGVVSG
jgi:hypothetical protein